MTQNTCENPQASSRNVRTRKIGSESLCLRGSTLEERPGGEGIQDQSLLSSEFEASLSYVSPFQQNKTENKTERKEERMGGRKR